MTRWLHQHHPHRISWLLEAIVAIVAFVAGSCWMEFQLSSSSSSPFVPTTTTDTATTLCSMPCNLGSVESGEAEGTLTTDHPQFDSDDDALPFHQSRLVQGASWQIFPWTKMVGSGGGGGGDHETGKTTATHSRRMDQRAQSLRQLSPPNGSTVSCDQWNTVFLNSKDTRTCYALVPIPASPSSSSSSSILNKSTKSQMPDPSWSITSATTATDHLLLALTRLNPRGRSHKRNGKEPLQKRLLETQQDSQQQQEQQQSRRFVPVAWYDDHGHKPPWRLSSAPKPMVVQQLWWPYLQHYLSHLPNVQQAMRQFLQQQVARRAPNNMNNNASFSWIVLVTNAHHVDLLVNWKCAAAESGMDLSRVLVIALDAISWDVASQQLQLATFYHESFNNNNNNRSNNPNADEADYASRAYGRVMLQAKVHVVHLLLSTASLLQRSLKHQNNHEPVDMHFLFHDVDIIPLQPNYLNVMIDYLMVTDDTTNNQNKGSTAPPPAFYYDMVFQYDFFASHNEQQPEASSSSSSSQSTTPPEYAPWFVNSGFYLVRLSERTVLWANEMVRYGDWVLRSNSHQAVVSYLLSRMQQTLRVRVLNRPNEVNLFPGGYHFHHKWDYMHALIAGQQKPPPYIFHMNYNDKKETKKQFLQQMGWWFVVEEEETKEAASRTAICRCRPSHLPPFNVTSMSPLCYYRDKPSLWTSCRDFPAVESGQSFW
ncbi:hypothetical protein ACA910_015578 [Epithemia clementina (nom. ined.)]